DDVGDVFALIGGEFQRLDDFFPLNDLDGIFFLVEKIGEQIAALAGRFIFQPIDFDAIVEDVIRLFQHANRADDFSGGFADGFSEVNDTGLDGGDVIHHQAPGNGDDKFEDVSNPVCERVHG